MSNVEDLAKLFDASKVLNQALLKRDTTAIFQAIAIQEDLVRDIPLEGKSDRVDPERRTKIIDLVSQIKKIQRVNKMLASSFLQMIDKTLQILSDRGQSGVATYGSRGNVRMSATPILVHQSG